MKYPPFKPFRLLGLWLFLSCTASSTYAVTAKDLDDLPVAKACETEFVNLGYVVEARDKGVSKAQIVEFSKSVRAKDAIPREAIDNVYAFPRLNRNAIGMYSAIACHARTYGVPVQPLSKFEAKLQACMAKPGNDPCGRAIRNEVLGLPPDFSPTRSAPPSKL